MDFMAIFEVINKGLSVVSSLVDAGKNVAPAIEVLKNVVTGAQNGTVSDEDLTRAEELLDKMIDEFNLE